ncbi:hypothetical protein BC831DRAFT_489773 [Entophlyctis helioformis]|nr:hypothetical protein BC831DRAFT_489773 [Entophlyctis helioformis]
MAKYGVFGGTVGVGKHFVEQALAAGHTVTVLARTPAKLDEVAAKYGNKLVIVQGDALNADDVKKVVQGQDAILTSLGNGPATPMNICSTASKFIIDAQTEFNVKRTVVITSFGCRESWNDSSLSIRPFLYFFIGAPIRDKNIQEELYEKSSLNWTVLRPGGLTNNPPKGEFRHGIAIPGGMIARADVAAFALKQIAVDDYLFKSPTLAY